MVSATIASQLRQPVLMERSWRGRSLSGYLPGISSRHADIPIRELTGLKHLPGIFTCVSLCIIRTSSIYKQLKTCVHVHYKLLASCLVLSQTCRWEKDSSYCKTTVLDQSSEFYSGVLEYTDTAVYDFLMGECLYMILSSCGGWVDLKSIGFQGTGLFSMLLPTLQNVVIPAYIHVHYTLCTFFR